MRRSRWCGVWVVVGMVVGASSVGAAAGVATTGSAGLAGAARGAGAVGGVDERVRFLMVRLAGVEGALDGVNAGLRAVVERGGKGAGAARAALVVQNGAGGAVGWREFYARVVGGLLVERGADAGDGGGTHAKPQAFGDAGGGGGAGAKGRGLRDVGGDREGDPWAGCAGVKLSGHDEAVVEEIARESLGARRAAEVEVGKMRGEVGLLVARRRELEAEQAGLWGRVVWSAVEARGVVGHEVFRFEVKAAGEDEAGKERAVGAGAGYVRGAVGALGEAEEVFEEGPGATMEAVRVVLARLAGELSGRLAGDPAVAGALDGGTGIGGAVLAARGASEAAQTAAEAYRKVVGDGAGAAGQRGVMRGYVQRSVFDCGADVLLAAERVEMLAKDWGVGAEVGRPVVEGGATTRGATTHPLSVAEMVRGGVAVETHAKPQAVGGGEVAFAAPLEATEVIGSMVGDVGRTEEGGVIVVKEGEKISTARAYGPPVKFTIVAMTDSSNLRIGYAADQIIFNWKVNPKQLRVGGGPLNGRNKGGGAGLIPRGEWVTIELTVRAGEMVIAVNGEERYREEADLSRVRQPLSIFTAGGAVVKVKSVVVGRG